MTTSSPLPAVTLDELLAALSHSSAWIELSVLAACLAAADTCSGAWRWPQAAR